MAKKTEAVITVNSVGDFTVTISESIPDTANESGKIQGYGQNGYYDTATKTFYPAHIIDKVVYVETPL